jgi:hypothetical protein
MRNTIARLLLLPPPSQAGLEGERPSYPQPRRLRRNEGGPSGEIGAVSRQEPIEFVQAQRDGLLRLREKLRTRIRDLQAENEALKARLAHYDRYPPIDRQLAEAEEARALEREGRIRFHDMPEGVYPGRPYVTQQELIQQGVTSYTRQNISRLVRDEGALPAVVIADRVLFPPESVRALVERERIASRDPSPRRRPRGGRE